MNFSLLFAEFFCAGRFKQLYLGNHSELNTYSHALFITKRDTIASQSIDLFS